jgi:hypothetical protein
MARFTLARLAATALLLVSCGAHQVFAIPVKYEFSTDTLLVPPNPNGVLVALTGFSVNGSFFYDADTPLTNTINAPPAFVGASRHVGAITQFQGAVAGRNFSIASNPAVVANDGFAPPLFDFLSLGFTESPTGLAGFDLAGFSLFNARLFWIEDQPVPQPVPDFLSSSVLPSVLPTFNGRLALDFGPTGTPGPVGAAFFDNLRVVRVPEPGTSWLLVAGLLAVVLASRRRAAM